VFARLLFAALVLAVLAGAQEVKYVQVELKDGSRVVGRVVEEECTDDILVVRQLKGGTKTTIPWDQVRDEDARTLRIQLSLEVEEGGAAGALATKGHEIRNKAGAPFRGLWMNEATAKDDGVYVLKTADGERRIPAGDVQSGPDPVELSLLDIFTPRELYERKLGDKQPESAEDHFRLAEFAMIIDALEEAKYHYEQVLALNDPKYARDKIERCLARVQKLIEQTDARRALKEIERVLSSNRFDKAATLIASFREKYGSDESLARAVAEKEEKSQEQRQAYYVGQVPMRLRDTVRDLLERKVKDEKELTLRAAQEYAGGEPTAEASASRQAVDRVATELGITTDEVLAFWAKRMRRNIYKGFYRDGTFIVIDNLEDALAKAPKPPKPAQGKEAPKLPAPSKPNTPDEWWKAKVSQKKTGDLRDWLFAWWAEKSGMCDLLDPKDEPCSTCNGKGYTQRMITTPQGSVGFFNRCQSCYMAKFYRVVRFR
jgi:tetratricopeptide (TPR) repeat protein